MSTLHKMTKTQVIAQVKKTGTWKGYMVGCNVNTYHIIGGWSLGFYFELFYDENRGVCVVDVTDCIHDPLPDKEWNHSIVPRTFADHILDWSWYNANSETGMYPHFYRLDK